VGVSETHCLKATPIAHHLKNNLKPKNAGLGQQMPGSWSRDPFRKKLPPQDKLGVGYKAVDACTCEGASISSHPKIRHRLPGIEAMGWLRWWQTF